MGKFKVKNGLQVEGLVESSGTGTVITVDTASGEFSYTSSAALAGVADGNGIYDGSGNVPAGTAVSLTNNFQALQFVSGSNSRLVFNESISELTVNNSNANYDFRIIGQTDTALFKTDASNNTIGIGSLGSSNTKLYVAGGTTHPYGMQVQAGGNSTFGFGILARTTNVSGSAEGGRFEASTATSHTGAQHCGVRAWADYGNTFTCGIQGSAGTSGITYGSTMMGVSAYIGTNDNVPSNNTSYAFHGRNRRTKGNIKYGAYVDCQGTMETASATTYAGLFGNSASSPSGSAYGLYVSSNSTSLTNYGLVVTAANGTNNYGLVASSGHVILNDSGGDWDFQVKGDTDTNLLFADASADSVGIGKSLPNAKFDVNGNAIISGSFTTTGARVRNTRTITLTNANFGGGAATLNADDDIVLIIDNTTTTPGVGTGSLDISALLNSVNGRCIELVKVKDGTGGGIILTAQTMAGQELYLNGASQTFGTRTVCTDLAMSLTIMASGATPSGSAWGTGW